MKTNIYIKKTVSSSLKTSLSELPPNLRPSSLFPVFYSNNTLKLYFSDVFYFYSVLAGNLILASSFIN